MKKDLFDIKGKVVIVTGAGGKLGSGYAKYLAAAGAYIYAWDHTMANLKSVLGKETKNLRMQEVDITDESAVVYAIAEILKKHKRIDGVVNNAAMNPAVGSDDAKKQFVPYEHYEIELFRKEMDTNVTGMMIIMKHVASVMMKQGTGSIVNVASEIAVIAHDHRVYQAKDRYKSPAYAASKTAVVGLSRQWAARMGEFNVRVNSISIGGVASPGIPEDFAKRFGAMNMLGRMARPHEYEATIQYLLSDASSFMTGNNLVIDGGKSAW
jgi:NAD(P)-dependent dehydrogenase (short-subunit alcohol dehydrogenase family)